MGTAVVSAIRLAILPPFTLIEGLTNAVLVGGLLGQQGHDALVTGRLLSQNMEARRSTSSSGCKVHP